MPAQNYSINTRDHVVGQVHGILPSTRDIVSWKTDFAVGFGAPVVRSGDRKCTDTTGLTTNTPFYLDGITVRTINHEQTARAGDGTVAYSVDDIVGVMEEGKVYVLMNGTHTEGGRVYVDEATGAFHATDASGRSLAENVRLETSGASGDIALVRIATSKILID